jgi:hypothetical protein
LAWVAVAVGLIATVLVSFGGYLLGTVDGDSPWPATAEESGAYYTGRTLIYAAAGVLIAGTAAVILISKRRGCNPLAWALVTAATTGFVALGAFACAYALGS